MACACKKTVNKKFVWTPPPGSSLKPTTYDTKIEAQAKVLRKGGSFTEVKR